MRQTEQCDRGEKIRETERRRRAGVWGPLIDKIPPQVGSVEGEISVAMEISRISPCSTKVALQAVGVKIKRGSQTPMLPVIVTLLEGPDCCSVLAVVSSQDPPQSQLVCEGFVMIDVDLYRPSVGPPHHSNKGAGSVRRRMLVLVSASKPNLARKMPEHEQEA
jgi:hypothetical protein